MVDAILNTPLSELLGRKKAPPRIKVAAPKPRMGATLCCAGLRMTVQAGLTDELWEWLGALGWRELQKRRKPLALQPLSTSLVNRLFDSTG